MDKTNEFRRIEKGIIRKAVLLIFVLLLCEVEGRDNDGERQNSCRTVTADKDIQNLIASGRRVAEPCPCIEQKIMLDNTFEKTENCYRQWFFQEGAKQMCCYSMCRTDVQFYESRVLPECENGNLITGGSAAGYLLLETKEEVIEKAHQDCCGNDSTIYEESCQSFNEINPPDNCSAYLPPSTVISSGDPRIETIDGNSYDFNGHGEYVFLTDNTNFEIQSRTGYVVKGNNDSTIFTAFALSDKKHDEQIELHYDRGANDIRFYRNGKYNEICNASSLKGHGSLYPCEGPKQYNCSILAGGGKIIVQKCGFGDYAQQITFKTDNFMSIEITTKHVSTKNLTGLAGHQEDGFYVMRNKSRVAVNASASKLFDFAESWSLRSVSDSIFKYNTTGGNFTSYNKHHTRPKFLEDLLGNLTALFENFTHSNISKFNNTCRDYWNNEPNEQCLLTIARTRNYSLGVAVMKEGNSTRRKWEILHNKAPEFLDGFPHNITVQYKNGFIWSINITDFVTDDHTEHQDLKFEVQTKLPTSEYTIENDTGIFTWTVGTGLRYIDTDIVFFVIDGFNAKAQRAVTINYCGCEEPEQCSSVTSNSNSTDNVKKASCNCPEYATGLYCEKIKDTCPDNECYQNDLCNATTYRLLDSWPCAPCPNGRHQVMTLKQQTCEDIDECDSDYTGKDKCQQNCSNTNGSFTCSCRSGYTLNADKRTCDDIDECSLSPSNCTGKNEVCLNTEGNFSCICKPGYSKTNGVCEKAEGPTYVGHMSFSISVATEHVTEINKTINKPENIKTVQNQLAAGFNNTKGFLSVEVFRLSVVIYQEKRAKRGDDKNDKKYKLRADYIVHWKNDTDTKTIGEELLKSFENFTRHTEQHKLPGTQSNLKIGNVVIYLNSAESRINNATEGGLCTVPDKTDCDRGSTNCIDKEHGKYECKCKSGYSPAHLNTKFCTDINECDDFKKNGTIGERCVHGSCYNSVGSWNCSCPANRTLQNVGNTTFPVYRCQGNFSYIGNLSILWRGQSSRQTIVNSIQNQLKVIYSNNTLKDTTYRLPISSLFVSATVLSLEEDRSASVLPMHKYTVLYNLRMGEHVGHDTVSSVLKTVFNNGSVLFDTGMIFRNTSYYIFRDSDNILCNLTSNDNCDPATTDCQQQNGTTFCKCKDGYKILNPSEKFCIDIDECVEKHMTCSGHGKCKNTREGYTCVCTEGYIMNRTDPYNVSCNDIDECNSREYTCKNGSCSNTDGNWNCICPSLGFWRNEFSKNVVVCEDINECSNSSYFCGGECNNTFGSWTCDCGTGYQSHPNKTKYASNITCDDIDECAENKTDCSGHGNCRNILGDYTCDCDTGFILNETYKSCDDIDECSSSSYFCGGKCNNTFGSWACDCGTGYQSHQNKTKYASNITCEDIDECTENKIDCSGHGNCTNVPGGYICVCDTGFIFNETNKSCEDIDECQSPNYTCGGEGNCSNTDGNWTCSCPAFGYRRLEYSENEIGCEDIDECSDSTYYCGGTCNNTLGNWTCECDTGYTRESYEEETIITCEDINECDNKESCIDGVCRNQDGSWTCICPDGKEPKTINATTILCSGGYVYIATIGIAVTGHVGNKDPELKVYLETQIKTAYESKYPEHNVRVEIISISKGSTDRKKRQTSENLAVEFVLHFDEPLESENITNAWQDYRKESCPKGICKAEKNNDISVDLPFNVIFEEDVVFEEDKQSEGLCKIPQNNFCNPDSTKCQYINATLNCECKIGYTRKSDFECKVSKNTCNENPCQNDGSCHMINADTDFECRCRDGWTGKTCEDVQKVIVKSAETDLKTIFIATGSSLGAVVFILAVFVIAVCRWKAAKVKEVEKMSMRNMDNNDFKSFDGSLMNSQYMRDGQNFSYDRNSVNSYRSLPYEQQNGGSSYRNRNGYLNGSAYAKPNKLPRPNLYGSMPNLANNDAHFYRSDTRRYSGEEPRRVLSYNQGLDANYDMDWRAPRNNVNGRRSPSSDYGRPSSPRPDYGRREKLNRSKDNGVGNGYSSGGNEYRRPEKRSEYYYGNRRSTNF